MNSFTNNTVVDVTIPYGSYATTAERGWLGCTAL